jgi:hypothetical protein
MKEGYDSDKRNHAWYNSIKKSVPKPWFPSSFRKKKNDFCLKKSSENHATKHKPKITFKQGNRKSETKNNVYNHQNHATNL